MTNFPPRFINNATKPTKVEPYKIPGKDLNTYLKLMLVLKFLIWKLIAIIIIFTLPYLCANLIQIIEDGIPASPTKSQDKPATLSKPSIDFKIVGKMFLVLQNLHLL